MRFIFVFILLLAVNSFSYANYITKTRVNLRSCPNTSASCPVLKTLPPNTEVEPVEIQNQWCKVKVPEYKINGWLYRKYIDTNSTIDPWEKFKKIALLLSNKQQISHFFKFYNPWKAIGVNLKAYWLPIDQHVLFVGIKHCNLPYTALVALFGVGFIIFLVQRIGIDLKVVKFIVLLIAGYTYFVDSSFWGTWYITAIALTALSITFFGAIEMGEAISFKPLTGILALIIAGGVMWGIFTYDVVIFELQILFSVILVIALLPILKQLKELFVDAPGIVRMIYSLKIMTVYILVTSIWMNIVFPNWGYIQGGILLLTIFWVFIHKMIVNFKSSGNLEDAESLEPPEFLQ